MENTPNHFFFVKVLLELTANNESRIRMTDSRTAFCAFMTTIASWELTIMTEEIRPLSLFPCLSMVLLMVHAGSAKVNFNLEQAMKSLIGNRGIAVLFL